MSGILAFRARRPADGTADTDLYDVAPLRDAFERFAGGATLRFLDPDQSKIDEYPYGTRVEVQVNQDAGSDQFAGVFVGGFGESQAGFGISDVVALSSTRGWWTRGAFVCLEPSRTTTDGIPMVEVDAVGYNHLLTREQIIKDYSSTAKTDILKDIITTFTPITWDANQVDVEDDSAIDLSLRGITPAEAISELASRSADEEWFVDDSFTFVFRQQDIARANAVTDTDVLNHDLPERGAREVNKFTVYYGTNEDQAWTEEDREAQEKLQDQLDADRRVVVADSDSFPEITTESEAKKKAKKRLDDQSVTQTGEIETPLGYLDTSAGDVFSLTLSDAGIDTEDFRVAQVDYEWGAGVVRRVIARNTGGNVDELLVSLSESLTNERLQNVATDPATVNAVRAEAQLTVTVDATIVTKSTRSDSFLPGQSELGLGTDDELGGGLASGQTAVALETKKATRGLLNLLRDLWRNGNSAYVDLSYLSAGTDDSSATRSDSELEVEVGRTAVQSVNKSVTEGQAEVLATIPAGGPFADAGQLAEFGIQDAASGGSLYSRLTIADTKLDASTRLSVAISITLNNDSDGDGVVTATGQERWRDLLVGESGVEPTNFVYGDGTSDPSVSDTSLDNQIHEDAIDSTEAGSTGIVRLIERVKTGDTATEDISEFGQENSDDELLSRYQFEAFGESVEIEAIHGYRAHNP
jgi:hypothetical protein